MNCKYPNVIVGIILSMTTPTNDMGEFKELGTAVEALQVGCGCPLCVEGVKRLRKAMAIWEESTGVQTFTE